ncbi:hypothetical protein KKP04_14290 [Rhodomicrobium sp. Az07]|uniref:hypothetical protein n=1 Tax=Rhodomicrobium sp. Az07 TaxID=2839034 RepID=UPI001BE63FC0|nr:hypothetical protein [Rhodomicrobium sp. Az07]MBT3072028.1 hypothetical protein [Rhodomicrobium sp. Az07]
MLVLKITAYAAMAVGAFGVIIVFCTHYNAFCLKRFGVELLTLPAFAGVGIAAIIFWEGVLYYSDALAKHENLSNGLALLGLGGVGLLFAFVVNIRLTNVFYGVVATLVQLVLGAFLAPFMIIGAIGAACESPKRYVEQQGCWDRGRRLGG